MHKCLRLFNKISEKFRPEKDAMIRLGVTGDAKLKAFTIDTIISDIEGAVSTQQEREKMRIKVVRSSRVVFSTFTYLHFLSSCNKIFDTVIIDDAQGVSELFTLVPLRYGCRRLIAIGDIHQPHNPFASFSDEVKLQPFNLIGRCSKLSKWVVDLPNIHRRDTPCMYSLFDLENEAQCPSIESECKIMHSILDSEIDTDSQSVGIIGFNWEYTDKLKEKTRLEVLNIDEIPGSEFDVIVLPLWTMLFNCDLSLLCIQKSLSNIDSVLSKARSEVLIIGSKKAIEIVNPSFKSLVQSAKVHSITLNTFIKKPQSLHLFIWKDL